MREQGGACKFPNDQKRQRRGNDREPDEIKEREVLVTRLRGVTGGVHLMEGLIDGKQNEKTDRAEDKTHDGDEFQDTKQKKTQSPCHQFVRTDPGISGFVFHLAEQRK